MVNVGAATGTRTIMRQRAQIAHDRRRYVPIAPITVVIVPSHELVDAVARVVERSHNRGVVANRVVNVRHNCSRRDARLVVRHFHANHNVGRDVKVVGHRGAGHESNANAREIEPCANRRRRGIAASNERDERV